MTLVNYLGILLIVREVTIFPLVVSSKIGMSKGVLNMNGLEAIKAMNNEKIVIKYDQRILYKIEDGALLYLPMDEFEWKVASTFSMNADYDIYIESGWYCDGCYERLLVIDADGEIVEENPTFAYYYKTEDVFSKRSKAEEIEFKQRLLRKLQRYADLNNDKIDWNNQMQDKYAIIYDYDLQFLDIMRSRTICDVSQVYFSSRELAQKATELFKNDLVKYFTYDWSKGE